MILERRPTQNAPPRAPRKQPAAELATETPAQEERRGEPRSTVDLVVFTYPLGSDAESGPTRSSSGDVSTQGMFVATERPHPRGRVVWLETFANGSEEEPVRSRAVVRWRRRWLEPRGMGVELLDVSDEDRDRLRRWMGESEATSSTVER